MMNVITHGQNMHATFKDIFMILNLTDVYYESSEVCEPDTDDSQVLYDILGDISRVDEAVLIISNYEPTSVIVDVSDEYFVLLREGLENSELVQGLNYECT